MKMGPNNSFPDDPRNTNGWIDYGIGVGIGFAVLFVLGMLFTLIMWITCCCIKCCKNCIPEFPDYIKKNWLIVFAVYAIVMAIMGFIAIGLTVGATNAINGSVESVGTFADNVGNFGSDIGSDLRTVNNRLNAQVDFVNQTLQQFRFSDIYAVVDNLETVLNNTDSNIVTLNNTIYEISAQFNDIISNFTYLQQKERDGRLTGVPRNDSVIDAPADNDGLLISARNNLNTFRTNVADARSTVQDAETEYVSGRDQAIGDAKNSVNGQINQQIDGISGLTTNLSFSRERIRSDAGPYIDLSNAARMGIVIGFVLLNLIFVGLWFLGYLKNMAPLTEAPYWVAAFTIFWIMLIAGIHIVIYIPVRDVCDRKIEYITSPGVQNQLRQLIPSDLTDGNAFNDLLNRITGDPLIILNCGPNETFFSRTQLTLFDFVPEANDTLNNLVGGFVNETSRIDIKSQADQALTAFASITANLTVVREKITNYTIRVSDAQVRLGNIEPQLVLLVGNASNALQLLVDRINSYTVPYNGEFYDRSNFSVINVDTQPKWFPMDSSNRSELNTTVNDGKIANQTFYDVLVEVDDIRSVVGNMNTTLSGVTTNLGRLDAGIVRIGNNASVAETSLRNMTSLQDRFISTAIGGITTAVANIREILKLGDVGECNFIGEFYRNGIEGGVCGSVKNSVGGAGVSLALFGIFMFLSTWPILWSRSILFDNPSKVKDEDL